MPPASSQDAAAAAAAVDLRLYQFSGSGPRSSGSFPKRWPETGIYSEQHMK